MSKDNLASEITGKIKHFLEATSPQEAEYQKQIDEMKARIESEKYPLVAKALKGVVKELEANRPDNASLRRQEAAEIILAVAKDLGLPIGVKSGKKAAGKASGGSRTPKAEINALADSILAGLKKHGGSAKIAVLEEELKADGKAFKSALAKLGREGKAVSTGAKGKNGGTWKIA